MRVVTFKIDEELLEKLDRYALSLGMTRSDVIRKAIAMIVEGKEPRKIRIRKVVLV